MRYAGSLFFLFLGSFSSLFATHNRAGEISYTWKGGYAYEVIVTTYTKIGPSIVADRCDLTVYFGDGDSAVLPRINGPQVDCNPPNRDGSPLTSDMQLNIYKTTVDHVYPGPGSYRLFMFDPNRNSDIVNIPNSVSTPFYIEAYLFINPLLGGNNSAILTYPPIDNACLYKCFIHNPGAFDPDGDSLSYSLGVCLGQNGNPLSGYYIPNGVTLDPVTGDLLWCAPQPAPNPPFTSYPQEYNFVIYIKEWREYNNVMYMVGFTERDMQVDVDNCPNNPPDILTVNDTCVTAGDTLTFIVTATDADGDLITLSATGAPLMPSLVNPAATFPTMSAFNSVSSTFTWITGCNLVRQQPYQVLFKAIDNDPNNPLVDLESVFITIVADGPTNLAGTASCGSVNLTWNQSSCNPVNNNVIGYEIFVDDTCNQWMPAVCETGVPAYTGYTLVGSTNGIANTTFTVNNLAHGVYYSFRIVTKFSDGARSYASLPICIRLKKDVPIITHVDVVTTSTTAGVIDVKWVKPLADPIIGLDTNLYPGPYRYELFRSPGYTNPATLLTTFSSATYAGLNAVSYTDVGPGLNTDGTAYVYRLDFYSNNTLICQTRSASSVYLALAPSDNALTLSWNFNVPWTNYRYVIYKESPTFSSNWVAIDSTTATTYVDDSLVNGSTYCYYILARGQYSDTTLPKPLNNRSEIKCGIPQDLTAPCPPTLGIVSDCNLSSNLLSWSNPNTSCADDVVSYNIYYTPVEGEDMIILVNLAPATVTTFMHDTLTSIAGCYAITAIDSFGNESALSNVICIDNCPIYELPNVFTPNGDGSNDFFIPFPYKYVKDIDLHVYNRWGEEVFKTVDPAILWDGKHQSSKQLCSDGVYYYVCQVNEIRLKGIQSRVLTGFVHLLSIQGK